MAPGIAEVLPQIQRMSVSASFCTSLPKESKSERGGTTGWSYAANTLAATTKPQFSKPINLSKNKKMVSSLHVCVLDFSCWVNSPVLPGGNIRVPPRDFPVPRRNPNPLLSSIPRNPRSSTCRTTVKAPLWTMPISPVMRFAIIEDASERGTSANGRSVRTPDFRSTLQSKRFD